MVQALVIRAVPVSNLLAVPVRKTNASVVMAQPPLAKIALKMVLTNVFRAARVSPTQETSALSATRTLAERADGFLAMVGVLVLLVTLIRTDACALLELAVSTESAEHLLIVQKPRTFHAFSLRAPMVNVLVVRHFDTVHAAWTNVPQETLVSALSRWPPMCRQCRRCRDRMRSLVTSLAPAYFSQVSARWCWRQGFSVVVAMTASS